MDPGTPTDDDFQEVTPEDEQLLRRMTAAAYRQEYFPGEADDPILKAAWRAVNAYFQEAAHVYDLEVKDEKEHAHPLYSRYVKKAAQAAEQMQIFVGARGTDDEAADAAAMTRDSLLAEAGVLLSQLVSELNYDPTYVDLDTDAGPSEPPQKRPRVEDSPQAESEAKDDSSELEACDYLRYPGIEEKDNPRKYGLYRVAFVHPHGYVRDPLVIMRYVPLHPDSQRAEADIAQWLNAIARSVGLFDSIVMAYFGREPDHSAAYHDTFAMKKFFMFTASSPAVNLREERKLAPFSIFTWMFRVAQCVASREVPVTTIESAAKYLYRDPNVKIGERPSHPFFKQNEKATATTGTESKKNAKPGLPSSNAFRKGPAAPAGDGEAEEDNERKGTSTQQSFRVQAAAYPVYNANMMQYALLKGQNEWHSHPRVVFRCPMCYRTRWTFWQADRMRDPVTQAFRPVFCGHTTCEVLGAPATFLLDSFERQPQAIIQVGPLTARGYNVDPEFLLHLYESPIETGVHLQDRQMDALLSIERGVPVREYIPRLQPKHLEKDDKLTEEAVDRVTRAVTVALTWKRIHGTQKLGKAAAFFSKGTGTVVFTEGPASLPTDPLKGTETYDVQNLWTETVHLVATGPATGSPVLRTLPVEIAYEAWPNSPKSYEASLHVLQAMLHLLFFMVSYQASDSTWNTVKTLEDLEEVAQTLAKTYWELLERQEIRMWLTTVAATLEVMDTKTLPDLRTSDAVADDAKRGIQEWLTNLKNSGIQRNRYIRTLDRYIPWDRAAAAYTNTYLRSSEIEALVSPRMCLMKCLGMVAYLPMHEPNMLQQVHLLAMRLSDTATFSMAGALLNKVAPADPKTFKLLAPGEPPHKKQRITMTQPPQRGPAPKRKRKSKPTAKAKAKAAAEADNGPAPPSPKAKKPKKVVLKPLAEEGPRAVSITHPVFEEDQRYASRHIFTRVIDRYAGMTEKEEEEVEAAYRAEVRDTDEEDVRLIIFERHGMDPRRSDQPAPTEDELKAHTRLYMDTARAVWIVAKRNRLTEILEDPDYAAVGHWVTKEEGGPRRPGDASAAAAIISLDRAPAQSVPGMQALSFSLSALEAQAARRGTTDPRRLGLFPEHTTWEEANAILRLAKVARASLTTLGDPRVQIFRHFSQTLHRDYLQAFGLGDTDCRMGLGYWTASDAAVMMHTVVKPLRTGVLWPNFRQWSETYASLVRADAQTLRNNIEAFARNEADGSYTARQAVTVPSGQHHVDLMGQRFDVALLPSPEILAGKPLEAGLLVYCAARARLEEEKAEIRKSDISATDISLTKAMEINIRENMDAGEAVLDAAREAVMNKHFRRLEGREEKKKNSQPSEAPPRSTHRLVESALATVGSELLRQGSADVLSVGATEFVNVHALMGTQLKDLLKERDAMDARFHLKEMPYEYRFEITEEGTYVLDSRKAFTGNQQQRAGERWMNWEGQRATDKDDVPDEKAQASAMRERRNWLNDDPEARGADLGVLVTRIGAYLSRLGLPEADRERADLVVGESVVPALGYAADRKVTKLMPSGEKRLALRLPDGPESARDAVRRLGVRLFAPMWTHGGAPAPNFGLLVYGAVFQEYDEFIRRRLVARMRGELSTNEDDVGREIMASPCLAYLDARRWLHALRSALDGTDMQTQPLPSLEQTCLHLFQTSVQAQHQSFWGQHASLARCLAISKHRILLHGSWQKFVEYHAEAKTAPSPNTGPMAASVGGLEPTEREIEAYLKQAAFYENVVMLSGYGIGEATGHWEQLLERMYHQPAETDTEEQKERAQKDAEAATAEMTKLITGIARENVHRIADAVLRDQVERAFADDQHVAAVGTLAFDLCNEFTRANRELVRVGKRYSHTTTYRMILAYAIEKSDKVTINWNNKDPYDQDEEEDAESRAFIERIRDKVYEFAQTLNASNTAGHFTELPALHRVHDALAVFGGRIPTGDIGHAAFVAVSGLAHLWAATSAHNDTEWALVQRELEIEQKQASTTAQLIYDMLQGVSTEAKTTGVLMDLSLQSRLHDFLDHMDQYTTHSDSTAMDTSEDSRRSQTWGEVDAALAEREAESDPSLGENPFNLFRCVAQLAQSLHMRRHELRTLDRDSPERKLMEHLVVSRIDTDGETESAYPPPKEQSRATATAVVTEMGRVLMSSDLYRDTSEAQKRHFDVALTLQSSDSDDLAFLVIKMLMNAANAKGMLDTHSIVVQRLEKFHRLQGTLFAEDSHGDHTWIQIAEQLSHIVKQLDERSHEEDIGEDAPFAPELFAFEADDALSDLDARFALDLCKVVIQLYHQRESLEHATVTPGDELEAAQHLSSALIFYWEDDAKTKDLPLPHGAEEAAPRARTIAAALLTYIQRTDAFEGRVPFPDNPSRTVTDSNRKAMEAVLEPPS